MARVVRKRGAAPPEQITYFFLISETSRAAGLSAAQHTRARAQVTRWVDKERGKCRLYQTSGGVYDFISMVTDISPAAAIRLAHEINQSGNVRATLVTGFVGPEPFK